MSRSRRNRLTRGPLVAAVLAAASIVASTACLIAEPPTDPPRLPQARPTIVRGSVVPSASGVLGRFPSKFLVPVELYDSNVTFEWSAWVDFNPVTGEGLDSTGVSEPQPSDPAGRVRTLEIQMREPSNDRCHVIEVVVGLRLLGQQGAGAHAADSPGGDVVTWFYNPSGDPSTCPIIDAGLGPPEADGGADGAARPDASEAGPGP